MDIPKEEEFIALAQMTARVPPGFGVSVGRWNIQWTVSIWMESFRYGKNRPGLYVVGATMGAACDEARAKLKRLPDAVKKGLPSA